ncbi:hypothetical protein [Streptomyces sp. NPDC001270]|uniref:hypothetical protein n=1 Tax=Streptomyces sp. NPDC001270 TaxID=3364554 RepID=UPI00368D98FA
MGSSIAWRRDNEITQTVEYKIHLQAGPLSGLIMSISATDDHLANRYIDAIRGGGAFEVFDEAQLPAEFEIRSGIFQDRGGMHGNYIATRYSEVLATHLVQTGRLFDSAAAFDEIRIFLIGGQPRVPQFGSPPRGWFNLSAVMAQAVGTLVAIGKGGGGVSLLLCYAGGVVLVRFIDPMAAEAGRALAEGIGVAIRRAFGLNETPQLGVQIEETAIESSASESGQRELEDGNS